MSNQQNKKHTNKDHHEVGLELSNPNADSRFTWLPAIATALSMMACYGTLIAISLLSVAEISIKLNNTVWASTIVVFAILAIVAIAIGNSRKKYFGPLVLASMGACLVSYAMFISYSVSVEIIGFGLLIMASIWDFLAKRAQRFAVQ